MAVESVDICVYTEHCTCNKKRTKRTECLNLLSLRCISVHCTASQTQLLDHFGHFKFEFPFVILYIFYKCLHVNCVFKPAHTTTCIFTISTLMFVFPKTFQNTPSNLHKIFHRKMELTKKKFQKKKNLNISMLQYAYGAKF